VEDLESSFTFEAGEVVITEFSHKYTVESVADIAAQAGLSVERRWTDDQGFFCEFLLRKPPAANRELGQAKRKEELAARLEAVRSRTLDLLANVSDDFLRRRVHDFYSPIGWHFGHVGRTEEYWICKATGAEPSDPQLSFIYSDLADNPKDNRINIPDREGTILYLKQTREFALRALEAADLSSSDPYLHDGYAWEFAIQHECQHHETIAEMLHLIQWKLPQEPVEVREWRSELKTRMIRHEGGVFTMGDANIHGYDNEKDPHLVHVEPFELAEYPVTCYQWSEFISDGGYENRRHWTEAGWEWLKSNHVKSPFYWKFEEGGYSQFGPFGLRALNPDEPVMGISHHEAVAYANWKGLRLPTETEWEYAASQSGSQVKRKFPWGDETPDRERACHGMNSWGPCQAGTSGEGATPLGVQEMAGNVWEWTASKFLPYPGFEAFPYDGYSKDHMLGGHFVCRGGSWATSPIICRNTFRNWYVPTYRQGFLGVRLANS
jgi:iron(II)-dependent oxidoreductase